MVEVAQRYEAEAMSVIRQLEAQLTAVEAAAVDARARVVESERRAEEAAGVAAAAVAAAQRERERAVRELEGLLEAEREVAAGRERALAADYARALGEVQAQLEATLGLRQAAQVRRRGA